MEVGGVGGYEFGEVCMGWDEVKVEEWEYEGTKLPMGVVLVLGVLGERDHVATVYINMMPLRFSCREGVRYRPR